MSYYSGGLDDLYAKPSVKQSVKPELPRFFSLYKDESEAKVVILTKTLREFRVVHQHYLSSWGTPIKFGKEAMGVIVPCLSPVREGDPNTCPICFRQRFSEIIRRREVLVGMVVSCQVFTDDKGIQWGHTIKPWAIMREPAKSFAKEAEKRSPDGNNTYGMVFTVSRQGENAPKSGNVFSFDGYTNMQEFMVRSPRAAFYQEKCKKNGRLISREEAGREYFTVDIATVLAPTPTITDYFLAIDEKYNGPPTAKVVSEYDSIRFSNSSHTGVGTAIAGPVEVPYGTSVSIAPVDARHTSTLPAPSSYAADIKAPKPPLPAPNIPEQKDEGFGYYTGDVPDFVSGSGVEQRGEKKAVTPGTYFTDTIEEDEPPF